MSVHLHRLTFELKVGEDRQHSEPSPRHPLEKHGKKGVGVVRHWGWTQEWWEQRHCH